MNIGNKSHTINKENYKNIIIGILLILTSTFIFVFFSVWIIFAKVAPYKENNYESNFWKCLIEFLINDKTYCLAIPLILPITIILFYFRWIAFRYFKHS